MWFSLFVSAAWAVTKVQGISNYFNKFVQNNPTSYTIFAGNTGNSCTGSGTWPCNSCQSSQPLNPGTWPSSGILCNDKQIYPSLNFTVTLSHDNPATYVNGCSQLIIALDGSTVINPTSISSYTPNQANQNVTATWTWGSLCNQLGSSNTCQSSFNKTIKVGFNSSCGNTALVDNGITLQIRFRYVQSSPPMTFGCPSTMGAYEGFCDYTVFPGDEKVYIINSAANVSNNLVVGDQSVNAIPAHATTADPSGIRYEAIRAFYAAGNFSSLTLSSPHIDISMNVTNGLSDRRITGLQNGQVYTVLVANKDEAGNVELFSWPGNSNNSITMSDSTTPVGDTQAARPEKVVGLLQDERCFIATAAYGRSDDPMVITLRKFRDQFLMRYSWGKEFVSWYYEHSPAIAKQIKDSNWLKAFVRGLLTPIVLMLKPVYGQNVSLPSDTHRVLPLASSSQKSALSPGNAWPSAEGFSRAQQEKNQLKGGSGYVEHPLESFGLEKIVHENNYYYRLPEMTHEKTLSVGLTYLPEFDLRSKSLSYQSLYGKQTIGIFTLRYLKPLVGYWLWAYGQVGLSQSTGNGYLTNSGTFAEESYSLYFFPLVGGLQLQMPVTRYAALYVGGGPGYLALVELRDDQKSSGFGGSFFIQGRAGAEISLTLWDRTSALQWYRDYGIANLALFAEMGLWQFFKSQYQAPGLHSSLGLNLEY